VEAFSVCKLPGSYFKRVAEALLEKQQLPGRTLHVESSSMTGSGVIE